MIKEYGDFWQLSQRIEYNGNGDPIYVGYVEPGRGDINGTSEEVWAIKQITYSGTYPVSVGWTRRDGDGEIAFNSAWDDRATETYS